MIIHWQAVYKAFLDETIIVRPPQLLGIVRLRRNINGLKQLIHKKRWVLGLVTGLLKNAAEVACQ